MWNKLKIFFGIKGPKPRCIPRYIVVKWRLGDRWAVKDKKTGKFKSLSLSGAWWDEGDTHFCTCCTSSSKEDVIRCCEYLNNNGSFWEEVE